MQIWSTGGSGCLRRAVRGDAGLTPSSGRPGVSGTATPGAGSVRAGTEAGPRLVALLERGEPDEALQDVAVPARAPQLHLLPDGDHQGGKEAPQAQQLALGRRELGVPVDPRSSQQPVAGAGEAAPSTP